MARDDEALLRLVTLAMLLDSNRGASTRDIRAELYPDATDVGFHQAFERDKNRLREVGIVLVTRDEPTGGTFTAVDRAATYQSNLSLEPGEAAQVAIAAYSALTDPAIPATAALRLGRTRLIEELSGDTDGLVASNVALESGADGQGAVVDTLLSAIRSGAPVSFHYVNAKRVESDRTLEPYGLHFLNGRWYVVGREVDGAQAREGLMTFAAINMSDVTQGRSGSFTVPDSFSIDDHIMLPFQFPARGAEGDSAERREVTLEIPAELVGGAPMVTRGRGEIRVADDGSATWDTFYLDINALCRFVIGAGYRFSGEATAERAHLSAMLDRLEAVHG